MRWAATTRVAMARARAHIDPDEQLVIERLPRVPRDLFTRLLDLMGSDDDGARDPRRCRRWWAPGSPPRDSPRARCSR